MEEKELCRARFKGGFSNKTIIIFLIVHAILFIVGFFFGTKINETRIGIDDEWHLYRICWYGISLFSYTDHVHHPSRNTTKIFFSPIFFIALLLPPLVFFIWRALVRKNCSQSNLVLTNQKIYGAHKWFLKDEQILMPMSKIDNIIVRYNFIDRLYGGGGRTVRIASNSGFVNFPCVQNAEEFTRLAMEQLEIYRKSQTAASAPVPTSPETSITDKLKSLQSLKEQGILTEEEFNAKKAELLSNL